MKKLAILVLLLTIIPAAASARYHGHHGGGSHVSVSYGGGYYADPYYPAYYPAYRPVYVQPAPVIVQEVQPYGTYARPVQYQEPAPVYNERPVNRGEGYCREYTRNVKINGRVQQGYGTSCQQPDGSWQIIN